MANVTLEGTLKPWRDMGEDFFLTFAPYGDDKKNGLDLTPHYITLISATKKDKKSYFNLSIWGDIAQPFRGVVNIFKGLFRIILGTIKLIPFVFIGCCIYRKYQGNSTLLDAIGGEFKGLGYDFVNGLGILLRGALQIATTPLLLFRIPLRLVITFFRESKPNQQSHPQATVTVLSDVEKNFNPEPQSPSPAPYPSPAVQSKPPFVQIEANDIDFDKKFNELPAVTSNIKTDTIIPSTDNLLTIPTIQTHEKTPKYVIDLKEFKPKETAEKKSAQEVILIELKRKIAEIQYHVNDSNNSNNDEENKLRQIQCLELYQGLLVTLSSKNSPQGLTVKAQDNGDLTFQVTFNQLINLNNEYLARKQIDTFKEFMWLHFGISCVFNETKSVAHQTGTAYGTMTYTITAKEVQKRILKWELTEPKRDESSEALRAKAIILQNFETIKMPMPEFERLIPTQEGGLVYEFLLDQSSKEINEHFKFLNQIIQSIFLDETICDFLMDESQQPRVLRINISPQNVEKINQGKAVSFQSMKEFYEKLTQKEQEKEADVLVKQQAKNQEAKQRILDELPEDKKNLQAFFESLVVGPQGLKITVNCNDPSVNDFIPQADDALSYLHDRYPIPKKNSDDFGWKGTHKNGINGPWHRYFSLSREKLNIILNTPRQKTAVEENFGEACPTSIPRAENQKRLVFSSPLTPPNSVRLKQDHPGFPEIPSKKS